MKIRPLPEPVAARVVEQVKNFEGDFELSTSLRYDPNLAAITRHIPIVLQESFEEKFFLANLHYQRIKQGARLLKWSKVVDEFKQNNFNEALSTVAGDEPLAVRFAIKRDGTFTVTTRPVPSRTNLFIGVSGKATSPTYDVYIDESLHPASTFIPLKSNKRDLYNQLRVKYDIQPNQPKEVLIQNEQRDIVEATVCSVAALVDDKWVCPRLEGGGISSVMRSLLLDLNYIVEGEIPRDSLAAGQEVMLFNGVIGTVRAKIVDHS